MERIGIVLFGACLAVALAGYCPEGEPAHPQDVRAKGGNLSIFSDLTVEEMNGVLDYMYNRSGMRIATWARGTLNSSYIYVIEALPPRKAEALRYLDQRGPKPQRYAKVILYRGDLRYPVIEEYKVGPLPRPRKHEIIRNPVYKDPIPWSARSPMADHEMRMWESFLQQEMAKIEVLLRSATSGYTYGNRCNRKCLRWMPNTPGQWQSNEHKMWVTIYKDLEGHYLHPIGLQLRIDARSSDLRMWKVDYIWWRGTVFDTMAQFQESVRRRQVPLEPMRDPHDVNETTMYSTMNFREKSTPRPAQKGPRTFLPDGRRYKVEGHQVEWQGWEFNFGVRSVTGLHLNDIRFNNERIIYEIALQELAVFYSGESPVPLHTSYFDSFLGLGKYTYTLIPGLDCPHHATYFDMVHYVGGESIVYRDSVCVFEHTNSIPLRRHFQTDHRGGYDWVQGMDDKVLIVRSILTLANYEYIMDYEFHQHGGVEVRCTLSGYVISHYYTGPGEDRYGFQLFENGIGQIHHHAANFKVDLDINGQRNRVETLDIKANKVKDNAEGDREYKYANEFVRDLKKFEMDALTTFSEKEPKYLLFHNQQKSNQFGQPRAYRLLPANTALTLPNSDWKMQKAAPWTRYHVAVTQHNDYEQHSSSPYNSVDPFDPVVDFQSYIDDNENIVDEDLVAWVTLGTIHIPHTGDLPVVTTQNTRLTFHLLPFNYLNEDPSLASRDNIRVEAGSREDSPSDEDWEGHRYQYAGVDNHVGCTPRSAGHVTTSATPTLVLLTLIAMFRVWMNI